MTQIYAKIKRTSKYWDQRHHCMGEHAGWPWPFPVSFRTTDHYSVIGGPGGAYRLDDVNLFVVQDGRELRIR